VPFVIYRITPYSVVYTQVIVFLFFWFIHPNIHPGIGWVSISKKISLETLDITKNPKIANSNFDEYLRISDF
jgi:hypothetical protein